MKTFLTLSKSPTIDHLVAVLLILLVCSGCDSTLVDKRYAKQQRVVLRELKKLQNTTPEKELQVAWAKKDFRFIGVRGYATEVFGVENGIVNATVQKHGVKSIEGTGDVVFSHQQSQLQKLATKYATRYNQLLMRKLKNAKPPQKQK